MCVRVLSSIACMHQQPGFVRVSACHHQQQQAMLGRATLCGCGFGVVWYCVRNVCAAWLTRCMGRYLPPVYTWRTALLLHIIH